MTTPAKPRVVSVIVGARNRPAMLREALASIRALEAPDLTFEILVGDNGATPETRSIVAEFGGVYDHTETLGCAAARNLAMKRMTGEFVAFLDDDDVWTPKNIRPQIAMLDERPELAAVFGQVIVVDQNLRTLSPATPSDWPEDDDIFVRMLSGYFPQVGANVVRGDIARGYGLMDETLIGDSDWDWNLRIAREHKIGFVPVPAVWCRARQDGTYDKLQTTRVGFTQLIFARHSRGAWSRWKTPLGVLKSYYASLGGYCEYFLNAAQQRAAAGEGARARGALWCAAKTHPIRTLKALIKRPSVRRAIWLGHPGHRPVADGRFNQKQGA